MVTKNPTFVCPDCLEVKSSGHRVEIREEHRDKPGDGRRHTIKLRDVCRDCSDARERELRPSKSTMPAGYDSLFETEATV